MRAIDQGTVDEVRSLLAADPVLLAEPQTAKDCWREWHYRTDKRWPGKLLPAPMPAAPRFGKIDFTLVGATLYQMISAEWLGPDWEDALCVSRRYYREEHHYSKAEEIFEAVMQEHFAEGDAILARRIVPIGPWCVFWWERFPSGYRLDLELGEPFTQSLLTTRG